MIWSTNALYPIYYWMQFLLVLLSLSFSFSSWSVGILIWIMIIIIITIKYYSILILLGDWEWWDGMMEWIDLIDGGDMDGGIDRDEGGIGGGGWWIKDKDGE